MSSSMSGSVIVTSLTAGGHSLTGLAAAAAFAASVALAAALREIGEDPGAVHAAPLDHHRDRHDPLDGRR